MCRMLLYFLIAFSPAAAASDWVHDSRADPTTGVPSCVVRHASHAPGWPVLTMMHGMIFAWPDGDRAMGSPVSIRVDKQPARTGIEWITGDVAWQLLLDFQHGSHAITTHVPADASEPVETTADLAGIDTAILACERALSASIAPD